MAEQWPRMFFYRNNNGGTMYFRYFEKFSVVLTFWNPLVEMANIGLRTRWIYMRGEDGKYNYLINKQKKPKKKKKKRKQTKENKQKITNKRKQPKENKQKKTKKENKQKKTNKRKQTKENKQKKTNKRKQTIENKK